MRIFAIRGRNLASLAGDFELDFEKPPLAGAGLFAITGETGAGKSTILDAICLALFDKYPRIEASGAVDTIRDVGDEKLSSRDPASILSKHASEALAEVEFEAGGERLIARWAVRRSHNKTDGRLQKRERALIAVDGDRVIASGITEANPEIVRHIGLTFEQFNRTALLAQGEFDALLRAKEDERAELLEKITGTEIYSRVSKRVYERFKESEAALADLVRRSGELGLLDKAARANLEGEIAKLAIERGRLKFARDRAAGLLAWHQESEKLETGIAEAEAAVVEAAAAAVLAAERARRAALERALAIEEDFKVAEAAAKQAAETAAEAAAAIAKRSEAEIAASSAAEAAEKAKATHEAAKLAFADAGPLLDQATALDADLATAKRLDQAAKQDFATADITYRELVAAKQAAETQLAEASKRRADLTGQRDRKSALAGIADRIDAIRMAFSRLADARRELAGLGETLAADRAYEAKVKADKAEIDGRKADRSARLEVLKAARISAVAERDRLDPQATRQRRDRLSKFGQALSGVSARLERIVEAGRRRDAAAEKHARALAEREAAAARAEQAAHHLIATIARRDEAARGMSRAELMAGEAAAALRADLVDGEPCPVCGATDHPGHNTAALDDLVEQFRRRRAETEAETAAATTADSDARGAIAAAAAAIGQAEADRATAATDRDELLAGWPALLADLAAAADRADVALALDAPDSAALDSAANAATRLEAEIAELDTRLTAIAELDGRIATLEADRDALLATGETDQARAETLENALSALAVKIARATERSDGMAFAEAEHLSALTPHLGAAGLAGDALANPAAALAALDTCVIEWRELVGALADTEAAIADLDRKRLSSVDRLDGAATARQRAATERDKAAAQVEDLTAKRNRLFDGEPTKDVRHRLHLAQQEAETARRLAEHARGEANAALAASRTATDKAENLCAAAATTATAAAARLEAALEVAGLDRAAASELLAAGRTEHEALATKIAAAERHHQTAMTVLAERRRHRDAHQAGGAPEVDAAAAKAERDGLDDELAAIGETFGRLRAALDRDDEANATAAVLAAEIETARADHDVLAAVNKAVGSADGGKFRRFAQGITLDMLTGRANEQLATVNPRYRLERVSPQDLGLQVVDRDMGDEVRSTRTLSGGERFLVSLALALALASLEGRAAFVDTLLIDEGFGALDARSLDIAIDALEALQSRGRRVGIISHVDALHERIPVQVRIEKKSSGRSRMAVVECGPPSPS